RLSTFLRGTGAPRHLPSFPTRRSSDLPQERAMSTRLPLLLPLACSLALASFAASGHAQEDVDNAPAPSVQELLDASPPSDWRTRSEERRVGKERRPTKMADDE